MKERVTRLREHHPVEKEFVVGGRAGQPSASGGVAAAQAGLPAGPSCAFQAAHAELPLSASSFSSPSTPPWLAPSASRWRRALRAWSARPASARRSTGAPPSRWSWAMRGGRAACRGATPQGCSARPFAYAQATYTLVSDDLNLWMRACAAPIAGGRGHSPSGGAANRRVLHQGVIVLRLGTGSVTTWHVYAWCMQRGCIPANPGLSTLLTVSLLPDAPPTHAPTPRPWVQTEDRPVMKERVTRLREHHPVEKEFVVGGCGKAGPPARAQAGHTLSSLCAPISKAPPHPTSSSSLTGPLCLPGSSWWGLPSSTSPHRLP